MKPMMLILALGLCACNSFARITETPTSLTTPTAVVKPLPTDEALLSLRMETPQSFAQTQTFTDMRGVVALDYPMGWYSHGNDYDYVLTSFVVDWDSVAGSLQIPSGQISISISLYPFEGSQTLGDFYAYLNRGSTSTLTREDSTLRDGIPAGWMRSETHLTLFAIIKGYGVTATGYGDLRYAEMILTTLRAAR